MNKIVRNEQFSEKVDYYIISKESDTDYALGIVESNEDGFLKYIPITSRKYETEEEFDEFLNKVLPQQEITYLSKSSVENHYKEFSAAYTQPSHVKKGILFYILEFENKYNATVAVGKELMYALTSASNNYQKNDNNIAILNLLADSIESNSILSLDDINAVLGDIRIMPDIQRLINVCNDTICQPSNKKGNVEQAYSNIQNENTKLKQELLEIKESLTTLQKQNNLLTEENQDLRTTNGKLQASQDVFMDAYQKILTIQNTSTEVLGTTETEEKEVK